METWKGGTLPLSVLLLILLPFILFYFYFPIFFRLLLSAYHKSYIFLLFFVLSGKCPFHQLHLETVLSILHISPEISFVGTREN